MSDSQTPALARHHFLLRRLHSLTGIAPIGVFLVVHLTTNASVVWGEISPIGGVRMFQHEVDFIHSLPGLLLIEIFGLWLPIAFHSILGLVYTFSGKPNTMGYRYGANWRYLMQRISGWVGLIFIFFHVATLRWGWTWLPFSSGFDPRAAASSTAIALRGGADSVATLEGVVAGVIYLTGITMLVFHFANGLWTAAITWGITVTEQGMKRWGYVCFGVGVMVMALGWTAYLGFVTLDIEEARRIETGMMSEHVDDGASRAGSPVAIEESR